MSTLARSVPSARYELELEITVRRKASCLYDAWRTAIAQDARVDSVIGVPAPRRRRVGSEEGASDPMPFTADVPNRLLRWPSRSTPGLLLPGEVWFEALPRDCATVVRVIVHWDAPRGVRQAAVKAVTLRRLRESLYRFKQAMEAPGRSLTRESSPPTAS
jgi:uncharacterized membrane protein